MAGNSPLCRMDARAHSVNGTMLTRTDKPMSALTGAGVSGAGVVVEVGRADAEENGPHDPGEHTETAQHDAGDRHALAALAAGPGLRQAGHTEDERHQRRDEPRDQQEEPQQELDERAHQRRDGQAVGPSWLHAGRRRVDRTWRYRAGPDRADLNGAGLAVAGLSGAGLAVAGLSRAGLCRTSRARASLSLAWRDRAYLSRASGALTGRRRAWLRRAGRGRTGLSSTGLTGTGLGGTGLTGTGLGRTALSGASRSRLIGKAHDAP